MMARTENTEEKIHAKGQKRRKMCRTEQSLICGRRGVRSSTLPSTGLRKMQAVRRQEVILHFAQQLFYNMCI
jgi:hypothetical protein